MNKFVCLGAHKGDAVKTLDKINTEETLGVKELVWDEIHLFEPQPCHKEALTLLEREDSRITYHPVAAYIEDTKLDFFVRGVSHNGFIGSTFDKGKYTLGLNQILTVQAIDFVKWLSDNTSPDDLVYLDMDIECGEYSILPKLIESAVAKNINTISVEWHPGKSHTWKGVEESIQEEVTRYFGERIKEHTKIFGWL